MVEVEAILTPPIARPVAGEQNIGQEIDSIVTPFYRTTSQAVWTTFR